MCDSTAQREMVGWTRVRISWWSRGLFVGHYYGWVWYEYHGSRCAILFHQDLHVHLMNDGRIEHNPPSHLMNHQMSMLRAMEAPFRGTKCFWPRFLQQFIVCPNFETVLPRWFTDASNMKPCVGGSTTTIEDALRCILDDFSFLVWQPCTNIRYLPCIELIT